VIVTLDFLPQPCGTFLEVAQLSKQMQITVIKENHTRALKAVLSLKGFSGFIVLKLLSS
jgi:hypothetical protein